MTLSREIFRQYDIRGIVGRDLTAEHRVRARPRVRRVSRAARASRARSPSAATTGRAAASCATRSCAGSRSPASTWSTSASFRRRSCYWSLNHLDVVGGIQITGSHNPPEYNGFKLSLGTASIHGEEIQEIYRLAVAGKLPARQGQRSHASRSSMPYVDDIVARTGKLARRLKVVVDCGNGVGALVAPKLFDSLDVEWTGLFCESDGTFPNHHPDPTVAENLAGSDRGRAQRPARRSAVALRRRRGPHRRGRRRRRASCGAITC